jgi:ribosomal protein L16/L10AE
MKVSKGFKIIKQHHKKFQKKYSLGKKNTVAFKGLHSLKYRAVIISKKTTRILKEPLNSFLRVMSSIKGVHIKNHVKKFKMIKSIKIRLKFIGVYSKRANGLRMGKGKGGIIETAAPIRPGKTIIKLNYKYNSDYFHSKINRAIKKINKNEYDLFFL